MNTFTDKSYIKEDLRRKVVFLENVDLELEKNVLFFLYTRNNFKEPQQLLLNNNKSILNSNYNKLKPTKLYTHGWKGSYLQESCQAIKDGYYFF